MAGTEISSVTPKMFVPTAVKLGGVKTENSKAKQTTEMIIANTQGMGATIAPRIALPTQAAAMDGVRAQPNLPDIPNEEVEGPQL